MGWRGRVLEGEGFQDVRDFVCLCPNRRNIAARTFQCHNDLILVHAIAMQQIVYRISYCYTTNEFVFSDTDFF